MTERAVNDHGFDEKGIQIPMAQGRSTTTISMIEWIRTSRFSIENSLSIPGDASGAFALPVHLVNVAPCFSLAVHFRSLEKVNRIKTSRRGQGDRERRVMIQTRPRFFGRENIRKRSGLKVWG